MFTNIIIICLVVIISIITIMIHFGDYSGSGEEGGWEDNGQCICIFCTITITSNPPSLQFNTVQNRALPYISAQLNAEEKWKTML